MNSMDISSHGVIPSLSLAVWSEGGGDVSLHVICGGMWLAKPLVLTSYMCMYMYLISTASPPPPPPPDLRQAQLRSSECQDDAFVVPLVMQNKPPTVEGREGDELADVDLSPEQVCVCVCVFVGGGGCEMVCRVLVHSPKAHLDKSLGTMHRPQPAPPVHSLFV